MMSAQLRSACWSPQAKLLMAAPSADRLELFVPSLSCVSSIVDTYSTHFLFLRLFTLSVLHNLSLYQQCQAEALFRLLPACILVLVR